MQAIKLMMHDQRNASAGNGGHPHAIGDGVVDDFGKPLPSGLISDGGDEAFFQAIRNRVATNATGNLVVPHSVTDPFAAPLAGLI